MQDHEAHLLGHFLDLQQQLSGSFHYPLVDLNLAELGVSVASVAKTRYIRFRTESMPA